MKKNIIIAAIFVILLAVLFLITYDFNTYSERIKTIPLSDEGIIFSLVTYDGKTEAEPFLMCLGHSWVTIDNHTDHELFLRDYAIQPGETLAIGAWGVTGHWGVLFNAEPSFAEQFGRYQGRQSLSINIEEAQMKTLEDYVNAHDEWHFTRNCSYWASKCWNTLTPEEYHIKSQTILYTPERVQKSFAEFTTVEYDRDFSAAQGMFFYLDGIRKELRLCQ